MEFWIDLKLADFKRAEFLTIVGIPVIVRMPMFWTDSIRLQWEGPIISNGEMHLYLYPFWHRVLSLLVAGFVFWRVNMTSIL